MSAALAQLISTERMERAVIKVHERLIRATSILDRAGIAYAVIGGNAVAAWVSTKDEAAIRNTRDVDILLRRGDLERAKLAFESEGFHYRHVAGMDIFRDGPDAAVRDSVHVIFAGEYVNSESTSPNPDVEESERGKEYQVLSLEALVRTKLNSWRLKDRVHLQDMVQVGLIDESWLNRFSQELNARLQEIIDNPEG